MAQIWLHPKNGTPQHIGNESNLNVPTSVTLERAIEAGFATVVCGAKSPNTIHFSDDAETLSKYLNTHITDCFDKVGI